MMRKATRPDAKEKNRRSLDELMKVLNESLKELPTSQNLHTDQSRRSPIIRQAEIAHRAHLKKLARLNKRIGTHQRKVLDAVWKIFTPPRQRKKAVTR